VLGLDIGGTKLAAGVVTAAGDVVGAARAPSHIERGPDDVLRRLLDLGAQAMAEAEVSGVDAVGVGCGGPLDAEAGIVLSPPGLPDWDRVDVITPVANRFVAPAFLDNDATAAALGEAMFGPWSGATPLAYLTVSTGIGGGLIIDGRPYRGLTGNGLEFGHMVIDWRGRGCNCGQQGCVEAYVSGPAIARRAAERLGEHPESALAKLEPITAADVSAAASSGDSLAREVWDETTAILGRAVAVVINILEPQVVLLGGGVTNAGAMLIDPVRAVALSQVMSPVTNRTEVALAGRAGDVGVVGAAALAFDGLRPPERLHDLDRKERQP
jgi:glucokinase